MSESNWRPRFGTTQGQVWYWRYGSGILLRQAARHLDENRHCIAGLVLGWLCYSIASNMPANDRLGSKAVRRRREKDDVGFRQIGKEAIRFTRPPIDLSHRPRDGSVVSFLHCGRGCATLMPMDSDLVDQLAGSDSTVKAVSITGAF